MTTEKECKSAVFKVALRYGVAPHLITNRLLDASDKQLMLDGEIDARILDVAVRGWVEAGCSDYAGGCNVGLDWGPYEALRKRERRR